MSKNCFNHFYRVRRALRVQLIGALTFLKVELPTGWPSTRFTLSLSLSLSAPLSLSLTTSHVDVVCVLEAIVVVARRCRFSTTKSCFTDCEISVNEISCKFSVSGQRYRHPSDKKYFLQFVLFSSFLRLIFVVCFCAESFSGNNGI